MPFNIDDHSNTQFIAEICNEAGEVVARFTMADLSYHRWNEIGFMVVADTAMKIKDPKDPKKMIDDVAKQNELNALADNKRNIMRIVDSLENGEGINWGIHPPATLEAKAERFYQRVATPIVIGLLGILRNRAFGRRVSVKDAADNFPDVSGSGGDGDPPETHDTE